MPRLKSATDELAELADNSVASFNRALRRVVRGQLGEADRQASLGHLRTVLVETMTLADLLGRRRLMLELAASGNESAGLPPLLFGQQPTIPRLTFLEAVRDLTSRDPLKGFNWRQVAEIYQTRQGFAMARSADVALTERVQQTIERFMRRGIQLRNAEKIIAEMGGFTTAYAETVYRTNLSTAYSAGRFEQATQPEVAAVIGAFEYVTAKDSDVRRARPQDSGENHLAAEGFIAATTDEIWDQVAPPSGYSCRCTLRMVPREELKRRNLVHRSGRVTRMIPAGFSAYTRHAAFSRSRARAIYR